MSRWTLLALVALATPGLASQAGPVPGPTPLNGEPAPLRVLVYTHSAGFEHAVVRRPDPEGATGAPAESLVERTLRELAERAPDLEAVVSRDPAWFDPERLATLDAVLFFTTGELPLTEPRREALLAFVREGGGFVGVHSATDTLYEYPPYLELVGGAFDGHPWHERVRVVVEDREHPAVAHLGASFEIVDEIYQFRAPFDRARLHVLLRLDVEGLDLARDAVHRTDRDFALAWCKEHGRGRVFYTALGHRPEVWADERFLRHVAEGIRWSAGRPPGPEPAAKASPGDAPERRAEDPIPE